MIGAIVDSRAVAGNFGVAIAVQAFSFLVSAVSSFVVPKVMGVESFGYWQLFLFYVGYLGFLQLGQNDGLYLRYGGRTRESIGAGVVTQQFAVNLVSQAVVALVVAGGALVLADGERSFVFVALAVMIPAFNAKRYWGYVFQAINEPRLFSYSVLVESAGLLAGVLVLMTAAVTDFKPYLAVYLIAELCSLAFCLARSRGLLRWNGFRWAGAWREALENVRVGAKLVIATMAGMLILGVARFAVDAGWDIRTFGSISLAVTVVTFFLNLLAQVSLVLFPALRQTAPDAQRTVVLKLRSMVNVLSPLAYVAYFPIAWLLQLWLPAYAQAFALAALLMPICVFDGEMQVVYATYFKVARRERRLMIMNVAAVVSSAAWVGVAGFLLHNLELVLVGPSLVSMGRALVADTMLRRMLAISDRAESVVNVLLTSVFLGSVLLFSPAWAAVVTAVACAAALFTRRRAVLAAVSMLARPLVRKHSRA